jgi:hypothetical protein
VSGLGKQADINIPITGAPMHVDPTCCALNFINNNKQWITLICRLTTNISTSETLL